MGRRSYGLKTWVVQRLTAVYMLVFSLYFVVKFLLFYPFDAETWQAWFQGSFFSLAVVLFFSCLLLHAWIGMRDVIMDYVRSLIVRFSLLALVAFFLVSLWLWVIKILFGVHL